LRKRQKRTLKAANGSAIPILEVVNDTTPRDSDLTTVKRADSEADTVPDYVQKLIDGVDDSIV